MNKLLIKLFLLLDAWNIDQQINEISTAMTVSVAEVPSEIGDCLNEAAKQLSLLCDSGSSVTIDEPNENIIRDEMEGADDIANSIVEQYSELETGKRAAKCSKLHSINFNLSSIPRFIDYSQNNDR